MILRPWHLFLAFAALLVPLQAGALGGSGGSSLQVSASLDYCGVGSTGISCKIDASWSGVEGAERYTASATLADGSVIDMGTVGGGGGGGATSIWVPFAGNGVYTVTVSAWGSDPEGKEEKIDDAEAKVEGQAKVDDEKAAGPTDGQGDKEPAAPPPDGTDPPAGDGNPPPAEPAPPAVTPDPEPTPVPGPETDPAQSTPDPQAGAGVEGGPATPSAAPDTGASGAGAVAQP